MRLASCLSSNIIERSDCLAIDGFSATYVLIVASVAAFAYIAARAL